MAFLPSGRKKKLVESEKKKFRKIRQTRRLDASQHTVLISEQAGYPFNGRDKRIMYEYDHTKQPAKHRMRVLNGR